MAIRGLDFKSTKKIFNSMKRKCRIQFYIEKSITEIDFHKNLNGMLSSLEFSIEMAGKNFEQNFEVPSYLKTKEDIMNTLLRKKRKI